MTLPALANTGFTWPNCTTLFTTGDAMMQHLSGPGPCGQWLVQILPSMEPVGLPFGDEYLNDVNAANDVDTNRNFNNPFNDSDDDSENSNHTNIYHSLEDDTHYKYPETLPPSASAPHV
ncbi:hypothetical protein F5J12DRAFT_783806 [Pisolithus orientalis]|uniref:uncharacterized protein n=1 Tax=Pisolithus orientalis TaxID=936130 RepID=UPI002224D7FE|nr:uncharacterized protein F5J12DRAFT_783806 [Pisolithus orientalis]KAI6002642.1 hypothetical protein F5J12DRAFT_783806 [Pisolithus orientalis]